MRIMRSRLFALCAALLVSACSADRTVTGPTTPPPVNLATLAVKLQSSARSVSGVAVSVTGPVNGQRMADESGVARFNELVRGKYSLLTSGNGFKPATREVSIEENQSQVDLTVDLEALPPFSIDGGAHKLVDGAGRDSYLQVQNAWISPCNFSTPDCFRIRVELSMAEVPEGNPVFLPVNWGKSFWNLVASDGVRPTSDALAPPFGPVEAGTSQTWEFGANLPQGVTHLMFVASYATQIPPSLVTGDACPAPLEFRRLPAYPPPCVLRYAYPISR